MSDLAGLLKELEQVAKDTNLKEVKNKSLEESVASKDDVSSLFEGLEAAYTESKIEEEIANRLSQEDERKLGAFSGFMESVTELTNQPNPQKAIEDLFATVAPPQPPVEVLDEPVVIEKIVEEPNEAVQADSIIQQIVSSLDDMDGKTEVKEQVDQISKLRDEFNNFRALMQQQVLSHTPGSGEVRLEFLDDVQRSTAKVDDKFLKYSSSDGKWIGADASGGSSAADDISAGDAAVTITTTSGDITIDAAANNSDIILKGTDGGVDTTFLTIDGSAAGKSTFNNEIVSGAVITSGAGLVIADAGNIGSASDTDAIAIASNGVVTFSQNPVFPDGGVAIADLDIDGGTDIGAGLADADLFVVDDGAGGTNRKTAASRIKTYVADVTLTTAAQTNITSVGTLTALTVDDVAVNGKVITMTGSSSDTAVFTAGTNGTLSIVTTDDAAAAANIQITADGTVDIDSAGILTLDSGAAINIEPASGSAILLDGTISVDAGVVTGATSITSTAFVGDITGDVTGNVSGTAATVTTAAQTNITSLGTLTTLTVDDITINGTTIYATDLILGEDAQTAIDFGTANEIDFKVDNAARLTLTSGALYPVTDNQIDLGTSSLEFKDAFFDGTVTSDAFAGPLTGDVTGTSSKVTVTDSTANTNFPVVFHDESNALLDDTGALRYNPSTGELLVPVLTVAGTTTTVDTVTMQAENAIIFEGATADAHETTLTIVDPTADRTINLPNQSGTIPVLAAASNTAVTSTPAELNLLDGSSANSVVNSKAVIYGSSGELAGTLSTAAQTNVTSLGTLTALTVDDVAVNGKVITMTGSSSDTAVFTAGTHGTLSIVTTDDAAAAANIQITADGTVDIDSAGVLTLDSGAAINIEPASGSAILLDGTISVDAGVVTGATSITSTAFVGDITGDVTGNTSGTAATVTTAAQPNITSLGTLTALTVDDVAINGKVMTMTGSSSDTAVFTAGTNGTLSIVTTDAAAAAANITITADGTFEADGTTITLDSAGDIVLDAAGNNVTFKSAGTAILDISNSSSDAVITSSVQDKDIIFKGDDGGVAITALTLDMSAAGDATFNNDIYVDKIRRASDSGTTTKILLNDEVLKLYAGHSSNEVVNIASGAVAVTGSVTASGILKTDDTTEATSTTDGSLQTDGGLSVVKDAVFGDDVKLLSDASVISFGTNSDVTLTHVHDTGVLLNAAMVVQFRDSAINIGSPADGDLDINADDEIELNSTLIDINGNVEISGTTAQVGVSTSTAKDIFNAGMSVKNGATGAGFVEFFEDSDNGTNKVTVIGPASTADVTLTLPNSAGTLATTAVAQGDATALAIALG